MTIIGPEASGFMPEWLAESVLFDDRTDAGRLLSAPGNDDERMQRMYAIAYGREATADELTANRKFLADLEKSLAATEPDAATRQRQAWNVVCHTIVAANEFIYVK